MVAFENRALVCRLQRPNGAVVLIGVTNTPDAYGVFVFLRHEMGLSADIEYCSDVELCDDVLLEWIDTYETDDYLYQGETEVIISPMALASDRNLWAKHVLLEGNTQIRMSRSA